MRGTRYLRTGNETLARFIEEELLSLDLEETLNFYRFVQKQRLLPQDLALLACNDRFFLLLGLCGRKDMIHPWLFDRCREVEADPDGWLDLWGREHYKSTIITYGGGMQEILCDPELTIAIFSHTLHMATKFVRQIRLEFQTNESLKRCFSDVLYKKPQREALRWTDNAITIRRASNPKEASITAGGIIDGQLTGDHYGLRIYDDVIELKAARSELMVIKATEMWEMSENLAAGDAARVWYVGTKYSHGDTYTTIVDRKAAKKRFHPATDNGRLHGKPVFLSQGRWDAIKQRQRKVVAAQYLQDPLQASQNTFSILWMRPYEVRPSALNVYIMVDPASGKRNAKTRTDRTAIAVVGIDISGNKYLLDGARHRMRLSERIDMCRMLYSKWKDHPGVQTIKVGWEQYGLQSDLEVLEERQRTWPEEDRFVPEELATPRDGTESKKDRIERLQPDFEHSRFFLPGLIYHEDFGDCLWQVSSKDENGNEINPVIKYTPFRAPTRNMRAMMVQDLQFRVARSLKRKDEDGNAYDITKSLIDEMLLHPFGAKDDIVDATSRIYDMEPCPASRIFEMSIQEVVFHDA